MALLPPTHKAVKIAKLIRKVSMRFTRRTETVTKKLVERMGPMDDLNDPAGGNPNATPSTMRNNLRSTEEV